MNRASYTCVRCGRDIDRNEHASGLCASCRDAQAPGMASAAGSGRKPIGLPSDPNRRAVSEKNCPSCGQVVAEDTVVCVQCGYDWRTGKRLSDARARRRGRSRDRIGSVIRLLFTLLVLCLAAALALALWNTFDLSEKVGLSERAADDSVPAAEVLAKTRAAHNRILLGDFAGGCADLREIAGRHPEIYSARRVPELLKLHGLVPGGEETSYRGNALDLIVLFCGRTGSDLSVDPEAAADLAAMEVDIENLQGIETSDQLAGALAPYGVVFNKVPAIKNRTTRLVTTPSLWAYSEALWELDRNDPVRAMAALDNAGLTNNTWACRQADEFRNFMAGVAAENAKLKSIESRMDGALNPLLLRGTSEPGSPAALRAEAAAAASQLAFFIANARPASDFAELIQRALNAGLTGEALWIMTQYDLRARRYRDSEDRLRKAGVDPGFMVSAAPSPERKALEQALRARRQKAERLVMDAEARFMTDVEGALSDFSTARALDRFNLQARIGCGLFIPKAHLDAVAFLRKHENDGTDAAARERLAAELMKEGRVAMAALLETGSGLPVTGAVPAETGVAFGLSAAETNGVFAVAVNPGSRQPPLPDAATDPDPLWQSLCGTDGAMVFADSGRNDPVAIAAGSVVGIWLASGEWGGLGERVLSVDFKAAAPGAGNESLGAAMALAGWSRLNERALVPGAAVTGFLKPDGSLLEAESVAEKVRVVHRRHSADIVFVPEANAPALAAVPLDQLLRTVIVTAGDIALVLRYAALVAPEEHAAGEISDR